MKCFVNGFRRWAKKVPLHDDELLPLAKMLFEKIDINYTGDVDLKECSDVLKNLPEIRDVFLKYEKGKETQYHDNILKKRMTSFSVYKIHSGAKKNTVSRASLSKKDSETLNEDKSLVKSNTNKNVAVESAKKATRPKNVIRRETQEKLKQL